VVIPMDFSKESAGAVRTAQQMTSDTSQLHLLHMLVPIDDMSPGVLFGQVTEEMRTEHVQRHLAELAEECGVSEAKQVVLMGSPGPTIADYARDQEAELIIIPSHGYHGIKRLVLGSVAEGVIQHAKCSVLVLRRSDAE